MVDDCEYQKWKYLQNKTQVIKLTARIARN